MKKWKVTYSSNGIADSIVKESEAEPSLDQTALLIRDDVFREGFLLVDQNHSAKDRNVELLRYNGVEILSIEELNEIG